MLRAIVTAAPIALLIATPAAAQKRPDPTTLTKDQAAKITLLFRDTDRRIAEALKGDEKLRAALEADIKQVGAVKDLKARAAAASAYQAKHAAAYRGVLAKANIDISALAKQLMAIAPSMKLVVKDGLTMTGQSTTTSEPMPLPPPLPGAKTITADDWTVHREPGCGGIGASHVSFDYGRIYTYSVAGFVGGCMNTGTLTFPYRVESGVRATVAINVDFEGGVFAAAVAGGGVSTASNKIFNESTGGFFVKECFAVAPLLWVSSARCDVDNVRLSYSTDGAGDRALFLSTFTSSIAALAIGTNADSMIKLRSIKIDYARH